MFSCLGGTSAQLFCELVMDQKRPPLQCPPTFKYLIFSSEGKEMTKSYTKMPVAYFKSRYLLKALYLKTVSK